MYNVTRIVHTTVVQTFGRTSLNKLYSDVITSYFGMYDCVPDIVPEDIFKKLVRAVVDSIKTQNLPSFSSTDLDDLLDFWHYHIASQFSTGCDALTVNMPTFYTKAQNEDRIRSDLVQRSSKKKQKSKDFPSQTLEQPESSQLHALHVVPPTQAVEVQDQRVEQDVDRPPLLPGDVDQVISHLSSTDTCLIVQQREEPPDYSSSSLFSTEESDVSQIETGEVSDSSLTDEEIVDPCIIQDASNCNDRCNEQDHHLYPARVPSTTRKRGRELEDLTMPGNKLPPSKRRKHNKHIHRELKAQRLDAYHAWKRLRKRFRTIKPSNIVTWTIRRSSKFESFDSLTNTYKDAFLRFGMRGKVTRLKGDSVTSASTLP